MSCEWQEGLRAKYLESMKLIEKPFAACSLQGIAVNRASYIDILSSR